MPAGLKVYKENGQLLFDTEKITYGLLKSGYLSFQPIGHASTIAPPSFRRMKAAVIQSQRLRMPSTALA
ncbi:hypothetical protein GLGCALEP_04269 [Pseudomonas sp. MM221]|nr:hypothetical protein GLGCALEP_04269 [Pseudomonas sp. MM221]